MPSSAIIGEQQIRRILGEVDLGQRLGQVIWLFSEPHERSSTYADRWKLYLTARYRHEKELYFVTLAFLGCSDIRIPAFADGLSLYGLTIQSIRHMQWDRLSVEAMCLDEDENWHDGLLWIRCDEVRVVLLSHPRGGSDRPAVLWADESYLPAELKARCDNRRDES